MEKSGFLVNGIQKTIQVHIPALLVYKNIELTKFRHCLQSNIIIENVFNPAHLKISTQFNNVLERLKELGKIKKIIMKQW